MKQSPEPDPLAPGPNLDFSKGARGKYSNPLQEGSNMVLLELDLLDRIPDSALVNEALRSVKRIALRTIKPAPHPRKLIAH
jgi:hypothetical protein